MKDLPKIAIKYSEENWANIKVAVDLIREQGYIVKKRKTITTEINKIEYLMNCPVLNRVGLDFEYYYNCDDIDEFEILDMPQDLPRLKEILGIDVPKDGQVRRCELNNGDVVEYRFKSFDEDGDNNTYSALFTDHNIKEPEFNCGWTICTADVISDVILDEGKYIEAEHKNGYHWTGSELVKIPEYVWSVGTKSIAKVELWGGRIKEIDDHGNTFGFVYACDNASTPEAFEAQEDKKKEAANVASSVIASVINSVKTIVDFTKQMESVYDTTIRMDGIAYNAIKLGEHKYKIISACKAGESLSDAVEKYGMKNATEFIMKDKRIKELKEENGGLKIQCELFERKILSEYKDSKLLKAALYDCEKAYQDTVECSCNQAETIKDLIVESKKLGRKTQRRVLIKENDKLTIINEGHESVIKALKSECENLENSRMGLKHQNKRLRDFVNMVKGFELK